MRRASSTVRWSRLLATMVALVAVATCSPTAASAAEEAPVKEIPTGHIGLEADATTKGNVCTVASGDECQEAHAGTGAGEFAAPAAVAIVPSGDIYIADAENHRVQEIGPNDEALATFGGERLVYPASIAIDPSSGDVYVEDIARDDVVAFSATGEFLFVVGLEVDETTKANLCTAISKHKCQPGRQAAPGNTAPGAFVFPFANNLLAVGGSEHLLYVGDEHRIQEFRADGSFAGEVRAPLEAISREPGAAVHALTIDPAGNIFVTYRDTSENESNTIYELSEAGSLVGAFEVPPRETEAAVVRVVLGGLAVDSADRIAVTAEERGNFDGVAFKHALGALYGLSGGKLRLISRFVDEYPTESFPAGQGTDNITVDSADALYATVGNEIVTYSEAPIAELTTTGASCELGADLGSDSTFNCELSGTVNPWNVPETTVSFRWGATAALEHELQKQTVAEGEVPVAVTPGAIAGLRPDATYHYELGGFDRNVQPPEEELRSSPLASFSTPSVPPRVVGPPSAGFVTSSSAVLSGEVNPENTDTKYAFQYAKAEGCGSLEEACVGVAETEGLESPVYAPVGATGEATGLQPDTAYRYRLVAVNAHGELAVATGGGALPEGTFTTPAGRPVEAATGVPSAVTSTSALISGTVTPGGGAATYAFELGLAEGAATQYGIVVSASVGAATAPVEESLELSGLQPGTTYAYRLVAKSGSEEAVGVPMTFTTARVPESLTLPPLLAQLAVPRIAFPVAGPNGSTNRPLTNSQKLAGALKACRKKPKKQRGACERQARKRYPQSKREKG